MKKYFLIAMMFTVLFSCEKSADVHQNFKSNEAPPNVEIQSEPLTVEQYNEYGDLIFCDLKGILDLLIDYGSQHYDSTDFVMFTEAYYQLNYPDTWETRVDAFYSTFTATTFNGVGSDYQLEFLEEVFHDLGNIPDVNYYDDAIVYLNDAFLDLYNSPLPAGVTYDEQEELLSMLIFMRESQKFNADYGWYLWDYDYSWGEFFRCAGRTFGAMGKGALAGGVGGAAIAGGLVKAGVALTATGAGALIGSAMIVGAMSWGVYEVASNC
jgi:hypothetical protein